jgi:hypothetical protein
MVSRKGLDGVSEGAEALSAKKVDKQREFVATFFKNDASDVMRAMRVINHVMLFYRGLRKNMLTKRKERMHEAEERKRQNELEDNVNANASVAATIAAGKVKAAADAASINSSNSSNSSNSMTDEKNEPSALERLKAKQNAAAIRGVVYNEDDDDDDDDDDGDDDDDDDDSSDGEAEEVAAEEMDAFESQLDDTISSLLVSGDVITFCFMRVCFVCFFVFEWRGGGGRCRGMDAFESHRRVAAFW